MQGQRFWVEAGKVVNVPQDVPALTTAEERKKLDQGQVRLTTGELGTEVKWHVQTPCLTSLFTVMDWLDDARLPIIMRFYVSGWFEEFHKTKQSAVRRLEEIIARGDRHFTCRTMVKEFDFKDRPLTPLLQESIRHPEVVSDFAVECVYEDITKQFFVENIGKKSAIRQVYGTFLSSFPCQSTGQYGQTVSEGYTKVLESGYPRYDHVLAAMRMPDNELFWVPYRRVIIPRKYRQPKPSVLVVSEITSVDIQLI